MKTTTITIEQKRVLALGERASKKLWDVYNKIYSDEESCDKFDEEHDNVLYQIRGLAECIDEFEEDFDVTYKESFQDALDLANKLDRYRKALLKLEKKYLPIEWIYG